MKNIICNTLLLLMTLFASEVSAQENSPYLQGMENADKAIAEGRWSDAEDALLSSLRSEPGNPSNPLLLTNLGMVRFYQGKDSLALETLNIAKEKAPGSVTVLLNRATVLQALHREADAFDDYSKVLEIDSVNTKALFYHGMIALFTLNNTETASVDFKKLCELEPDSENALIAQSCIAKINNDINGLVSAYTKLIERSPSVEYYSERALAYIMLKRYNDASADVNDGLKLNPNDGQLYLYRAYLNKIRFREADAIRDAKKAAELGVAPEIIAAIMK